MTAPATESAGEQGWVRLHPLTPLLRGGRFGLLLLALAGQQGLRNSPPEAMAAVLGAGVPAGLFVGWLSWRAMRYRVTATELQVESGVVTKRSRRVPLARVQAVDVVRPLYARVLGLAELRLEVVGAGDAEAPLSFLADDRARLLRTQLLDLAAGREAAVEGASGPEPDRVLVRVPTGPLVWSTLLGPPVVTLMAFTLALLATLLAAPSMTGGVLFAALPLLFGVGSFAVRRVLAEYGFTVAQSPDGLRLRHGLLDTRSQTIPPGRVQAMRLREPLLWRRFGWVRVEVDVAGYSGGEEQSASGALLPVAPRQLAQDLMAHVLGGPLPVPDRRVPAAARWRTPLQFGRLAVGLDDRHVVATSGVVTTTTDVAPLAKVQSLRVTQGPYERRLGLASLHVDTAGRQLPGAVLRHRSSGEAAALLEELTVRARVARERAPRT
ncbi:MAG: PH domain-containing protein [Mycobacteriales bacterium]